MANGNGSSSGWSLGNFTGRGPVSVKDHKLSQLSDPIPMIHGINVMGSVQKNPKMDMSSRMRKIAVRTNMDWGAPYGMRPQLPASVSGRSRKVSGTRSRKRR